MEWFSFVFLDDDFYFYFLILGFVAVLLYYLCIAQWNISSLRSSSNCFCSLLEFGFNFVLLLPHSTTNRQGMDCLKAVQGYIEGILNQPSGIKILLLDAETTAILSLASTQSNLLAKEVYITDRIDNPSRSVGSSSSSYPPNSKGVERLPHLKCICLLRPTDESIEACAREIREGRYGGYWLCRYSLSF